MKFEKRRNFLQIKRECLHIFELFKHRYLYLLWRSGNFRSWEWNEHCVLDLYSTMKRGFNYEKTEY